MKKLVLMAVVALFAFNVSAQDDNNGGFSGEVTVGLPVGDAGDFTSFAVSLNVAYTFEVSNGFSLGATTGYGHWFGKDGGSDLQFAPIAATVEVDVSEDVSVGGDVGYAINLGSGGGGDFYFRPVIAVAVSDDADVTGSFASISGDGVTFSAAQIGYRMRF